MKNIKTFEGFSSTQSPPSYKQAHIDEIEVTVQGEPMLVDVDFEILQRGEIRFYKTRRGGFKAELTEMPTVAPILAKFYSLKTSEEFTLQGQELQDLLSKDPGLEASILKRAEEEHAVLAEEAINAIEMTYQEGPYRMESGDDFDIPEYIQRLFWVGGQA